MKSVVLFLVLFGFVHPILVPFWSDENCKTPQNADGKCIYYDECPQIINLLKSAKHLNAEQRRKVKAHQCGYRMRKPMVCCDTPVPLYRLCGAGAGATSPLDEHPWLALIQFVQGDHYGFNCGGTLITDRHILTAAHCVTGASFTNGKRVVAVRLGEYDRHNHTDCVHGVCSAPPIDVAIADIIVHHLFDATESSQHQHDIAIIRLAMSVPFTRWIAPICLPTAKEVRAQRDGHTNLTIAGFGDWHSGVKQHSPVTVVGNSECGAVYTEVGRTIGEMQLCAGSDSGRDLCRADSGGPLMATLDDNSQHTGHTYLVGILSYGPTPCNQHGWPNVYTRVGSYINWITDNLR